MKNAVTFTIKHIIILLIGVALALVFSFIVRESDLSASVLSLAERETIQKAQWDGAFKKEGQQIEIFISEPLQNYDQLFVSLLFSPSEIQVITGAINSPYTFDILESSQSALLAKVSNFATGNVNEGILILPFIGEEEEITVEYLSDRPKEGQLFAVGFISSL
ncbi:MAG: hypothetical protein LBD11_04930 [Candidatus Peribacteria bacterium]|jgi:hypothetical protein|nr:hypothetical protein [Candidatus Peribacteria bacterium]